MGSCPAPYRGTRQGRGRSRSPKREGRPIRLNVDTVSEAHCLKRLARTAGKRK